MDGARTAAAAAAAEADAVARSSCGSRSRVWTMRNMSRVMSLRGKK